MARGVPGTTTFCEVVELGETCGRKRVAVREGMLVCSKHRRRYERWGSVYAYERIYETREGQRWCKDCQEWRPSNEFYQRKNKTGDRVPYGYCRTHTKLRTRAWRYQVAPEVIVLLLKQQQGCCAVCGSNDPGLDRDWHIDHDHSCCGAGRSCGDCIRGLLCHKCNLMIGWAGDDVVKLQSAIDYLQGTSRTSYAPPEEPE